uniref:Cellulose-growth-specific protein n=1 Tax=Ganoderma boninense TaxID=34458 RepID=A0A5K1K4P2_9APHY|nr:Cellulose-growth-specific protein [Ganoderma boninense]
MASFASWYNHQYASWNRVRNLHQQPYLARTNTSVSRVATRMSQNAVVIDMGTPAPAPVAAPAAATATTNSKSDTLFGPNIGVLGGGPEWTESQEKSSDVLTPEIVKGWIAKSKETHYSTTTLQALVNLKRPTLRLSPLENDASEDADHVDSQHHHALEFEYDCDAPKCAIRVYVHLSPKHPLAGKADASGLCKLLVFETTTDGGFGKTLKFEDGAMLELGRFEYKHTASSSADGPQPSTSPEPEKSSRAGTPAAEAPQRKKRFTNFYLRKRNRDRNVAGPALAVLDADTQPADGDKGKEAKEEEEGVRVNIKLVALDENGKELPSPNEQATYLHVVRFGPPPTAVEGAEEGEDHRPWVVKVVKREATIGLHTFHLHEIYGLSANSTTSAQPTAPPPTAQLDNHTYPPTVPPTTAEDEPSSECLLCLSSPREVVLLPCRHLVACRDCAVNMIEFGAGGTIVHSESETAPAADAPATDGAAPEGNTEGAAATGAGADGAPASPAPAPAPAPTPVPAIPVIQANPRRKRKAKGWFCPVCRQPYTSLLRITTTPPEKDEHRESDELDEHVPVVTATVAATTPTPAPAPQQERGRFGFLRAFGRGGQPQPDIERGVAPAANAA